MSDGYQLQENGRATGPHSLVVLRQKAEIRVIHPGSLVRAADASDAVAWRPIGSIPELHADLFPPKPLPKLAASAAPFVSANSPASHAHVPAAATDVFAILKNNSARDQASADALLKDLGPRPNNRRRDYLICAIALNLFAVGAGHIVGYVNPFVIGLAVMGNLGLAWVMFFVSDRY